MFSLIPFLLFVFHTCFPFFSFQLINENWLKLFPFSNSKYDLIVSNENNKWHWIIFIETVLFVSSYVISDLLLLYHYILFSHWRYFIVHRLWNGDQQKMENKKGVVHRPPYFSKLWTSINYWMCTVLCVIYICMTSDRWPRAECIAIRLIIINK